MTNAQALDRAQQLIGYQFKDLDLLTVALTHASVAESRVDSNERLEFLGDSLLSLVVCHELYQRYPEFLEGELTKVKSIVVSRKVCAQIADEIGLTPLLFLGKGMNGHNAVPTSLRAAVFEAVIGAILLDGGFQVARDFILTRAAAHLEEAADFDNHANYKSMLQQYAQKYLASTPTYEPLGEKGPDHDKRFQVCVTIDEQRFPPAWGRSKKDAEQLAAMFALQELQRDGDSDSDAEPEVTEAQTSMDAGAV